MRRVLDGLVLARKFLLSGELLLRTALIGFIVLLVAQLLVAAFGGGRAHAESLRALRASQQAESTAAEVAS